MAIVIFAFVMAIGGGVVMAAPLQTGDKPPSQNGSVRMLSGCVTPVPKSKRSFTLEDLDQGQTYRLSGTNVSAYAGQHVEILGAPAKKLVIVGGLYPSPNVAAGATGGDQSKAAIAAQSGPTANAPKPLIEFKVQSVRLTPGDCPKE